MFTKYDDGWRVNSSRCDGLPTSRGDPNRNKVRWNQNQNHKNEKMRSYNQGS